MINQISIQQKVVKRSQIFESNYSMVSNSTYHNQYLNLKKSSINLGVMPNNFSLPKTPLNNNHPSNISSGLTFNQSRPKLDPNAKQVNIDRQISQIHDKLLKLSQQVNRHDLEITNLTSKNNKGQQNIDILQPDFINRYSQKSILNIEQTLINSNKEIAHLKKIIQTSIKSDDMIQFAIETERKIHQIIQPIKLALKEQLHKLTQKIYQDSQKDRNNLQKEFIQLIEKNSQNINKRIKRLQYQLSQNNQIASLIKHNKSKYIALTPITTLKYVEMFQLKSGQHIKPNMLINQILFKIDNEGYLLDQQGFYILDHHNQQIKLDNKHIQILKSSHVLK